jgi:hypothetical protein
MINPMASDCHRVPRWVIKLHKRARCQ